MTLMRWKPELHSSPPKYIKVRSPSEYLHFGNTHTRLVEPGEKLEFLNISTLSPWHTINKSGLTQNSSLSCQLGKTSKGNEFQMYRLIVLYFKVITGWKKALKVLLWAGRLLCSPFWVLYKINNGPGAHSFSSGCHKHSLPEGSRTILIFRELHFGHAFVMVTTKLRVTRIALNVLILFV